MLTTAPSAAPTFVTADCRVSCSLLSGGASLPIALGQRYATLQLPPHFKIEFDATVAGLGTNNEVRNLMQLVGATNNQELLSIGVPSVDNLRVFYNSVMVTQWGPTLSSGYNSGTFTRITTGYAFGHVKTFTSYATDHLTSAFVDTSGLFFDLYVSAADPLATNYRSSGGTIKNIIITGKSANC